MMSGKHVLACQEDLAFLGMPIHNSEGLETAAEC